MFMSFGKTTPSQMSHSNSLQKDDPVSVATYAYENDLLETPGWKHLRHIVKNQKNFGHMARQAALKSIHRAPIYIFGVQVPRTSGIHNVGFKFLYFNMQYPICGTPYSLLNQDHIISTHITQSLDNIIQSFFDYYCLFFLS